MALKAYNPGTKFKGGGLPGMKILRSGAKLKIYQPSYNKGATVFRPCPEMRNGQPVEWRSAEGDIGLSWFVQETVVMGWGVDSRMTALMPCSDEQNWPDGSPFQVFYDDMRFHAQFKSLLDRPVGGKGFSPISSPRTMGFIKGLLIEHNGKPFHSNPKWGVMLMLTGSASDAFYKMINTPADNPTDSAPTPGDPHGLAGRYKYGNPVELNGGVVVEFDNENKFIGSGQAVNLDGGSNDDEDRTKAIPGYGVRVWPQTPSLPIPQNRWDKLQQFDEPFEDVFNYMTGEEQLRMLITSFGTSVREAIMYTFGNSAALPASFKNNRTTVDMNANQDAPAQKPAASVVQTPPVAAPVAPATSQQAVQAPAESQQQSAVTINLDGDGGDGGTAEGEEALWEDASNESAQQVPQGTTSTVDSIRARLNAMKNK